MLELTPRCSDDKSSDPSSCQGVTGPRWPGHSEDNSRRHVERGTPCLWRTVCSQPRCSLFTVDYESHGARARVPSAEPLGRRNNDHQPTRGFGKEAAISLITAVVLIRSVRHGKCQVHEPERPVSNPTACEILCEHLCASISKSEHWGS